MLNILLSSSVKDSLSELDTALAERDDVRLLRAESKKEALDLASQKPVDLVIVDEQLGDGTGLDLAAGLLSINPMISCSVISGLSPEAFHEASEGLGIMARLPVHPGREHAESLLNQLRQIKNLTNGVKD